MSVVQFRTTAGALGSLLDARARDGQSPAAVAKRDLERFYTLLARSMHEVRAALGGEAGAVVVCHALNGVWLADNVGPIWAEVADHLRLVGADSELVGEEGDALVLRLRDMSPGAAAALADAVELWWHDEPAADRAEGLRRRGLID